MFKLIQRSRYIDFDKFSISRISSAPRRSLRLHSSNSPINSNEMQKVKIQKSKKIASVGFSEDNLNSSITAYEADHYFLSTLIMGRIEKQGIEIIVNTDASTNKETISGIAYCVKVNGTVVLKGRKAIDVRDIGKAEAFSVEFTIEELSKIFDFDIKYIRVVIRTDRIEIVRAMNGSNYDGWKFRDHYDNMKILIVKGRFLEVRFEHVCREENVEADREANKARKEGENRYMNSAGNSIVGKEVEKTPKLKSDKTTLGNVSKKIGEKKKSFDKVNCDHFLALFDQEIDKLLIYSLIFNGSFVFAIASTAEYEFFFGRKERIGKGELGSGIGNFFGPDHPLNRSIPVDVHNSCEAEITAVMVALENIRKWNEYNENQPVIVRTDFLGVVNAMNDGQMKGKFHDLYVDLRKLTERFTSVVFEHDRGHSGVEGNMEADRIARKARKLADTGVMDYDLRDLKEEVPILNVLFSSNRSSPEMALIIDPAETSFPATGCNVTVKIVSTAESKLAFKVKTSDNEFYRVKPVFGFVEPKADTPLETMRMAGPPKDDILVVQWAEDSDEETDPKVPFVAEGQQGEVILPVKAV